MVGEAPTRQEQRRRLGGEAVRPSADTARARWWQFESIDIHPRRRAETSTRIRSRRSGDNKRPKQLQRPSLVRPRLAHRPLSLWRHDVRSTLCAPAQPAPARGHTFFSFSPICRAGPPTLVLIPNRCCILRTLHRSAFRILRGAAARAMGVRSLLRRLLLLKS